MLARTSLQITRVAIKKKNTASAFSTRFQDMSSPKKRRQDWFCFMGVAILSDEIRRTSKIVTISWHFSPDWCHIGWNSDFFFKQSNKANKAMCISKKPFGAGAQKFAEVPLGMTWSIKPSRMIGSTRKNDAQPLMSFQCTRGFDRRSNDCFYVE